MNAAPQIERARPEARSPRRVHSFARAGRLWLPKGLGDRDVLQAAGAVRMAMAPGLAELGDASLTPAQVAGCVLWLRADVGVHTGASFVWDDQSGNGNDAVQTSAGAMPTVTSASSAWANRDVVTFTRSLGQWLECDDIAFVLNGINNPVTVIAALSCSSDSHSHVYLGWGHSTGAASPRLRYETSNSAIELIRCGDDGIDVLGSGAPIIDANPHVASVVSPGGTAPGIFLDRGSYTPSGSYSTGACTINRCAIGTTWGSGAFWNGDMAEIAVFSRALTAPERFAVELGMKNRWRTP